jgi:hypothetical protein
MAGGSPAFRTGYISLLLPASTGDLELRSTIRSMVIDALVEYETGPMGEAVELANGFD